MITHLFLSCVLLGASSSAAAWAPYQGFDVYRSATLTEEKVQSKFKKILEHFANLSRDPRSKKATDTVQSSIEREIKAMGDLTFVRLSYFDYIRPQGKESYIVIDVVDRNDSAARMPFRKIPGAKLPDPDGLLASWFSYWQLGQKELKLGNMPATDERLCAGYFCLWGSATPELAKFEQDFVLKVESNRSQLIDLSQKDQNPTRRAAAIYLLSYLKDGKDVVAVIEPALLDADFVVRSAALEVYSDVALRRKDLLLPVKQLIPAVDYPLSAERSKALSVLVALADNPSYRPYLLASATPYLVNLLKMKQPAIHDLAYTLLSVLSKQSIAKRDYDSWNKWVESQKEKISEGAKPSHKSNGH